MVRGLLKQLILITVAVIYVQGSPLPEDEANMQSLIIQCPKGREFRWKKTEPEGLDSIIYYSCGGEGERTRRLHCHGGYKAQYKKFTIPHPVRREVDGQEPSFGLFHYGNDPNVLDRAAIVYACLKP